MAENDERDLYLWGEELNILLRLNGAADDTEVSHIEIKPLADKEASRVAATIYEMWKKGKVTVVPWPEVTEQLKRHERHERMCAAIHRNDLVDYECANEN